MNSFENRPYIICHMVQSIDGKVTGDFLSKDECAAATEVYYAINRSYKPDGFACGRVTMEGSFTNCWYPDLSEYDDSSSDSFELKDSKIYDGNVLWLNYTKK